MENSVLSVRHLTKAYGHRQVLHNVNFDCQWGHVVGLVGANGAGKTTIMKAVLNLVKFQGVVTINGQRVGFNHHRELTHVGSLVEAPGLYPYLTGRANLELFADATATQAQRIQEVSRALEIETVLDCDVKTYSVGLKQKLGIALALVNQPSLVILDEPMKGLDPQATKALRELIVKRQAAGTTFLISSHILDELQRIAEDLVVINQGRVICNTSMREVLAQNQHFLVIKTLQEDQAVSILRIAGYRVVARHPLRVKLRGKDVVAQILRTLTDHNIMIDDVRHEDGDLEQFFLHMLDQQEAQHA